MQVMPFKAIEAACLFWPLLHHKPSFEGRLVYHDEGKGIRLTPQEEQLVRRQCKFLSQWGKLHNA